jgi:predicted DNA-binding transcriptional regulator AlpA
MNLHTGYPAKQDQGGENAPLAVTDQEVAKLLRISQRHLWNLDRDGKIGPRPIRLGKSRRWPLDQVRRWLSTGCPDRATWEAERTDA